MTTLRHDRQGGLVPSTVPTHVPTDVEVYMRFAAIPVDDTLVASAADTTPRDYHGRWTKHGAASEPNYELHTTPDPNADFLDFIHQENPALSSDELTALGHYKRVGDFNRGLDENDQEVIDGYLDWTHVQINSGLRHGTWDHGPYHHDNMLPGQAMENARVMTRFEETRGSPAPATLYRGQAKGKREPFDYEVGQEFTDKGFGSWSGDPEQAESFATDHTYVNMPGFNSKQRVASDSVFTVLKNDNFHHSIPGTTYETETIMPAGVTYRVTRIVDFVPTDAVAAKRYGTHRYMEVEVVHKDLDPGLIPDEHPRYTGGFSVDFSAADTTPRDYHGRWTKGAGGAAPATYEVHEVDDPRNALLNYWDVQTGVDPAAGPMYEQPKLEHMVNWSVGFGQTLTPLENDAHRAYMTNAYAGVNRGRRHDEWVDPEGKYSPAELHQISDTLEGTFDRGEPWNEPLYRGQKDVAGRYSTKQALGMNVGDEFVDKGFGSWSADSGEALFFSKSYGEGTPRNSVLTHMTGLTSKTIPGEAMETEVIVAPGTRYRVTRIVDFVKPGTDQRHRYMEVEAIQ